MLQRPDEEWAAFKTTYGKTYSESEELVRMQIFFQTSLPLRIKANADRAGRSHLLELWKDNTSALPVTWCLLVSRTWLIAARKIMDATVETCNSLTTTSSPTKELIPKLAILTLLEMDDANSRLPTLEQPSAITKFFHPVMKLPPSMLLLPSVQLPSLLMLHTCLSNSTPRVSTLKTDAEMVIMTWITLFWPLVMVPKMDLITSSLRTLGELPGD